jgi:hypothetical protein
MLTTRASRRPDPRPAAKRTLIVAAALVLAATPGIAGGMYGGGGGWGAAPQQSGGQDSWGRGGDGRWGPRHGGRSGYPSVGRWQNCHSFSAASRAAFRQGDYARGNALQDRFYNCMRSRWIR